MFAGLGSVDSDFVPRERTARLRDKGTRDDMKGLDGSPVLRGRPGLGGQDIKGLDGSPGLRGRPGPDFMGMTPLIVLGSGA